MTRQFEDKPAVRSEVPLWIGLVSPSGGGKTFSALRLATGIQQVIGGDIFGVDTEADRMLHYSDNFKFRHLSFKAPFGSLDYLAAWEHCVNKGAKIIITDSQSHEHDGAGGMLDFQEKEVQRMAGDDYQKRERVKMLAWSKPKAARRRMLNTALQMKCCFIFCFRAKHISKPIKQGSETKVIDQGFVPIAGEDMVFEQTVNFFLPPRSEGVPSWQSEYPGEKMAMKLPLQFREILAKPVPLSEEIGRQLAEWAKGGPIAPKPDPVLAKGREAARSGSKALVAWWETLPKNEKTRLQKVKDEELKPTAGKVDCDPAYDNYQIPG